MNPNVYVPHKGPPKHDKAFKIVMFIAFALLFGAALLCVN